MDFSQFLKGAERITRLRANMQNVLRGSAAQLSSAAFSTFISYMQDNPTATLEQLEAEFLNSFNLPRLHVDQLRADLASNQARLAEMRAALYAETGMEVGSFSPARLQSVFQVDFPRIQSRTNKTVQMLFRNVQARNLPAVPTITAALQQSGMLRSQAFTLANTALAQFDNEYTFQISQQSGVDVFEFTGPDAQRQFCQHHLGKQYTSTEISQLNNGQGLPVRTSCGGYNCRHSWLAVPPIFQNRRG